MREHALDGFEAVPRLDDLVTERPDGERQEASDGVVVVRDHDFPVRHRPTLSECVGFVD
ncbi:hypothetical protein AKJ08_0433 [Vulgatibacter incomptus]|uniref:Uncharacterized protein n=1 Tax=Vulgatibacter incomptus TaxID=1391653 RepID=A0A0K1P9E4_9BACT|nr:hypothetical protein AKJ08_0433 [Vulgatibacter incomptus]